MASKPTPRITTHAKHLALSTALSDREAETLIRNSIGSDTPQYELADEMDIRPSTVSDHLNAATQKTGGSSTTKLFDLFAFSGPLTPAAFRQEFTVETSTEWIHGYKNQFPETANKYAPLLYVVHHHTESVEEPVPDHLQDRLADAAGKSVADRYEFNSLADMVAVLFGAPIVTGAMQRMLQESIGSTFDVEFTEEKGSLVSATLPGDHTINFDDLHD